MTSERAVEPGTAAMTAGGWCIHGVPYGPNWSCGQCSPTSDPVNRTTTFSVVAWTPDKVERVLFLLERIAKELETARLRR